jgi:hypothetical protein
MNEVSGRLTLLEDLFLEMTIQLKPALIKALTHQSSPLFSLPPDNQVSVTPLSRDKATASEKSPLPRKDGGEIY